MLMDDQYPLGRNGNPYIFASPSIFSPPLNLSLNKCEAFLTGFYLHSVQIDAWSRKYETSNSQLFPAIIFGYQGKSAM